MQPFRSRIVVSPVLRIGSVQVSCNRIVRCFRATGEPLLRHEKSFQAIAPPFELVGLTHEEITRMGSEDPAAVLHGMDRSIAVVDMPEPLRALIRLELLQSTQAMTRVVTASETRHLRLKLR